MLATTRRSALGLVVLAMLVEEPMHAYRMQKLIKQRGKDTVINVRQRASIYQTLDRLLRLDLIAIHQIVQTESHPDRTIYAITDQGRETVAQWMRDALTTVGAEFPEFPAAISVLTILEPDDAERQFKRRAIAVREALARLDAAKHQVGTLPRLFLLDDEYQGALLLAELTWLEGVIADFASGSLTWSEQWLRDIAAAFTPDFDHDGDLPKPGEP